MNLIELYQQLKSSTQSQSSLVFIENLPSDSPESRSLSQEQILEALKARNIAFGTSIKDLGSEQFSNFTPLGSYPYLKDGADGANNFQEFVDFLERRRSGLKEENGHIDD